MGVTTQEIFVNTRMYERVKHRLAVYPSTYQHRACQNLFWHSTTEELQLFKYAWRRARSALRHLRTFVCRGDCPTKRVKLSFLKEMTAYSRMCPLAVLRNDVSIIGILGSWDWSFFDVFSSKSDPQRRPSRLMAGSGASHCCHVFGARWVPCGRSLSFSLLSFARRLSLIF